MAGPARFERAHEGVKVPCLTAWLWAYIIFISQNWGGRGGSNPRVSAPQADALTTSPRPPYFAQVLLYQQFLFCKVQNNGKISFLFNCINIFIIFDIIY